MAYWQTYSFWILLFTTVGGAVSIFFDMRQEGTNKPTAIGWGVISSFLVLLILGILAIRSGIKDEILKESKSESRHVADSSRLEGISAKLSVVDSAMKRQGYKIKNGKIINPKNIQEIRERGRGIILNNASNNHIDQSNNTFLNEYRMTPDVEMQIKDSVRIISKRHNAKCCTVQMTEGSNAQSFYLEIIKTLKSEGYEIDLPPPVFLTGGPLQGLNIQTKEGKVYVTIGIIVP